MTIVLYVENQDIGNESEGFGKRRKIENKESHTIDQRVVTIAPLVPKRKKAAKASGYWTAEQAILYGIRQKYL